MNQTNPKIEEIMQEFREKFVGVPPAYHTPDHQNIQGKYTEKMLKIDELESWLAEKLQQQRAVGRDEIQRIMDNVCTTGRNFPARCYECGEKHASGMSWEEAYKINALFGKCFDCLKKECHTTEVIKNKN